MLSLLSIIGVGFFLGVRHATDADHIIAVTTIASRGRSLRNAACIGAAWGVGHTLTVMIVGGMIVLLGFIIPPQLGLSMEFCVGLMLVLLGVWNLKAFGFWLKPATKLGHRLQFDPHQHGDYVHDHPHGHTAEHHGHRDEETPQARLDSRFGSWRLYMAARPFVVGVVHGLAGSAAVAMLVLPMIRNPYWTVAYLAVFGIGTIVGMMLITLAIAWPLSVRTGRSTVMHRHLGFASGLLSIGFGSFMIYEIGFVQGLLNR